MATVQRGDVIDHTPDAAIAAGEVVVLSEYLIGVAVLAIPAGKLGSLVIEGIVDVPKVGSAFSVGDMAYYDEADEEVNTDSANPFLGKVVEDAASGDATVKVKLCPQWSFSGS